MITDRFSMLLHVEIPILIKDKIVSYWKWNWYFYERKGKHQKWQVLIPSEKELRFYKEKWSFYPDNCFLNKVTGSHLYTTVYHWNGVIEDHWTAHTKIRKDTKRHEKTRKDTKRRKNTRKDAYQNAKSHEKTRKYTTY